MALLPPSHLDAVVALGIPDSNGSIQYTATGFLYGHPVGESGEEYRIFLITNRHVVENIDILKARFNRPIGSDSEIYDIPLRRNDGSVLWTEHPSSDVAVVQFRQRNWRKMASNLRGFLGTDNLRLNRLGSFKSARVMVFSFWDFLWV